MQTGTHGRKARSKDVGGPTSPFGLRCDRLADERGSLCSLRRRRSPGRSSPEGRAKSGGEEGIRTPGSLSTSTVFKTAALNHSATSPHWVCLTNQSLRRAPQCTTGAEILAADRLHPRATIRAHVAERRTALRRWAGVRSLLQLLGGFATIAGILAALAVAGYVMWWLALIAIARLPMIGRRHRHRDWERLNRS